MNLASMSLV